MKSVDKSDHIDEIDFDIKNKEKKREEEIEEEIKEIERIQEEAEISDEKNVWYGSESLFVEDDDATEYEEQYSGIKFSFSLKDRELISCLKHCGWNTNLFIFGTAIFLLLDIFTLIIFILKKDRICFFEFIFAILISVFWILSILPSFLIRLAYQKSLIGQNLDLEIYPDSIIIKKNNFEQKIPLDGSCKYEDFEDMFLIFLKDKKVFIIPKRVIEPDLLPDVEAMLIAGTKPVGKD